MHLLRVAKSCRVRHEAKGYGLFLVGRKGLCLFAMIRPKLHRCSRQRSTMHRAMHVALQSMRETRYLSCARQISSLPVVATQTYLSRDYLFILRPGFVTQGTVFGLDHAAPRMFATAASTAAEYAASFLAQSAEAAPGCKNASEAGGLTTYSAANEIDNNRPVYEAPAAHTLLSMTCRASGLG